MPPDEPGLLAKSVQCSVFNMVGGAKSIESDNENSAGFCSGFQTDTGPQRVRSLSTLMSCRSRMILALSLKSFWHSPATPPLGVFLLVSLCPGGSDSAADFVSFVFHQCQSVAVLPDWQAENNHEWTRIRREEMTTKAPRHEVQARLRRVPLTVSRPPVLWSCEVIGTGKPLTWSTEICRPERPATL